MKCRDLMNRDLLLCKTDNTALSCATAMRDRDVGFAPIVDGDGRIAGTVTDRDLCMKVLAEGLPATEKLATVMERDVITCGPNDDMDDVEALMAEHKIRRIVVCDDDHCPIGVISLGDVVLNENDSDRIHRVFEAVHYPTPPEQPRV